MDTGYHLFKLFLKGVRRVLARRYGVIFADEVVADARKEYEHVRPHVPYIGGIRNVWQPIMTVNGWIVALHLAMRPRGLTAEDTIRICHRVFDIVLRRMPAVVTRATGRFLLSAPMRRFFHSQARRSQERRYDQDFVWRVEHSATGEMDLIFEECAVGKWYDSQGVPELKPYCNFGDVTYSRLMGMGVDSTETIGLGCEQCALRYQRGRETIIPPKLQRIIPTGKPKK